MIFEQAVLKTKGDSGKIEQKFLPFSKRAKRNTYLEDPGISTSCPSMAGHFPDENGYVHGEKAEALRKFPAMLLGKL